MSKSRQLRPEWIERRKRLHQVIESEVGFTGNASSLEGLGYQEQRWGEDQVVRLWAEAAARSNRGTEQNHVYVHVPFCKSICHFCNYKRLRPSSRDLMELWLERAVGSLERLAPSLADFEFHSLYIGGGTPSMLPAELLEELLSALDKHVNFVWNAARFFEADPAVLDARKLEVVQAHGIQHVAMGVQTLSAEINAEHDRGPQGAELIASRVESLRAAGIRNTSMDFLLGLQGTTPEQIFSEIDAALAAHKPRWVDLFFLTPTQRYVDLHFGGSREAFWSHQSQFAEQAPAALAAICRRRGYSLEGEVYEAFVLTRRGGRGGAVARVLGPAVDRMRKHVREHPGWLGGVPRRVLAKVTVATESPYVYTQQVCSQHLPLNLLGIGEGARSRIFGHAFLECRSPGDRPEEQGPTEYIVRQTDMAFEARSYLLMALRESNELSLSRLRRLFGTELEELLPRPTKVWERLNLGRVSGGKLSLMPSSRDDRARALMWLLDDEDLEGELARHRRMHLTADKLAAWMAPLTAGMNVCDEIVYQGVSDGEVRLVSKDGEAIRARVVPRLDRTFGVRLVVDRTAPGLDVALHRIQGLFRRNGSDKVGILSKPELRDGTYSAAGQHDAAPRGSGKPRAGAQRTVPPAVFQPEAEPRRPLTDAQRDTYWEQGYVSGVPILVDEEVRRLRQWLELIEAEQAARQDGRWTQRDFDPVRQTDHPLLEWAYEIARHPRILDAAESLLGANVMVRNVDVFVRDAHTRDGVKWHRDSASLEAEQTDKVLTVWLGLTRSEPDNGALEFCPGSHRGALDGEALTPEALTLPGALARQISNDQVVANRMAPGEASFHHSRLLHRSGGNKTPGRRVGVVLRLIAADVDHEVGGTGSAMVVRGAAVNPAIQTTDRVPIAWISSER